MFLVQPATALAADAAVAGRQFGPGALSQVIRLFRLVQHGLPEVNPFNRRVLGGVPGRGLVVGEVRPAQPRQSRCCCPFVTLDP
jgi:hypothetical protein